MTIHDDLRDVLGLLGKATDVRWLACERGSGDSDLWFDPYEDWCSYEDQLVRGAFKDADAQAIAAAVNFLRQHGPALLARQEREDARDAARYRVIRMYSVGANWPREFELAGIGAPAGLAAFGRTDPFATFSRHTLDGLMDDALGLLDGPKDVRPDYKEWRAASTADTLCKAKEVVDEAARSGGGG